jgi:hypothetical protein
MESICLIQSKEAVFSLSRMKLDIEVGGGGLSQNVVCGSSFPTADIEDIGFPSSFSSLAVSI